MDTATFQRAAAEALIGDCVAVYLGGSRALGWGHQASDIDLFALTDAPPTAFDGRNLDVTVRGDKPPIVISFFEGIRVDTEYWSTAQLQELAQRLTDIREREGLSHGDLDVLWRLRHSQFISGDEQLVRALQATVSRTDLDAEFLQRGVYSAEVRLDDAAGLLASGEEFMAAVSAREAFARVVDALLSESGSSAPPSKWRPKRLGMVPELSWLTAEYFDVETMAGLDPEAPGLWARRVILRCRELIRDIDGA